MLDYQGHAPMVQLLVHEAQRRGLQQQSMVPVHDQDGADTGAEEEVGTLVWLDTV
jgi:hypothetical protein